MRQTKPFILSVILVLLLLPSVYAQRGTSTEPAFTGYVTAIASPTAFDLNSWHVAVMPSTVTFLAGQKTNLTAAQLAESPIVLGEYLGIDGDYDRHTRTITAKVINIRGDATNHVAGTAVIDSVLASAPRQLLRCDGYVLAITPQTKMSFRAPYTAEPEQPAGSWLVYSGKRQTDGTIAAESLTFSVGDPDDSEIRYDAKSEQSFTAPNYDANKDGLFKIFALKGPIPAQRSMQQHLAEIGNRLVPAYQKALPDNSPAKFNFRFYAIDNSRVHSDLNTPDGLVLIPTQMLSRLQNDDQIAAVLADGIANVLEREIYRSRNARGAAMGVAIATTGGLLSVGALAEEKHIYTKMEQQRSRVSLGLMQDAGFNVNAAPIAWRLMAPGKPKPLDKIPVPEHSAYLLGIIGAEYRSGRPAASPGLTSTTPAASTK